MDGNLHKSDTGLRFNMPPPVCLPMQRLVPNSPHTIPQSPHNLVQSPHHVVQSPHHIQSPAPHGGYGGTYGGGGGGGVFQFSDAHIGMARSDKDSGLALSSNPHHSPMPHNSLPMSQNAAPPQTQYNKSLPTSTPVQGLASQFRTTHAHSTGSDAMLSAINYNDSEMLHDSAFDVSGPSLNMDESLLSAPPNASANNDSAFDLFDSDSNYQIDNQLSPQPFVDNSGSFNLGQNENSQNSSHGSGSSSVSSVSEKTAAKVGRPPRGRGGSQGRERASCPICGKMFNNSSALAKHKLTHSDERKHICTICAKAFKRQDHLNGHMMTHRSKKPFECKFEGCEKSYCDARSLRRHLENHHSQQLNDPSCMAASHFTFQFDQQVLHQTGIYRQPSAESKSPGYTNQFSPISPAPGQWTGVYNPLEEPKPVQCQLCRRRFKNIPALNGHMRLHGGYFKKDMVAPSTSDEAKAATTTACTTAVKIEPSSSSTVTSSSQEDVKPKMTSSASMPIIIAPRSHEEAFTSAMTSLTSGASVQSASRLPGDMMTSHMALSQHIEHMSLNAGAPPYPHPHSSIASLGSSISAHQGGIMSHMSGGEFNTMPRSQYDEMPRPQDMSRPHYDDIARQQYDDMSRPQDMRTNQFPSSAQMGMSQLARRRSNVPAPLDALSLNMAEHLNSPGPASCGGSHPATPSHPMTPSHPHTPAHINPAPHPMTPGHAQTASHPHTPIAHAQTPIAHGQTPNLPFTPSLAQTPSHPLTPHTPHTPTHPCTPGHQSAQHFQFPPPQEQYNEQQFVQQQNNFVQMQQQQQQQQQMHMQQRQEQLEMQQVQQELEQQLAQLQQEQTIQQIKEDLQSHERQQNIQSLIQVEIEQLQQAQSHLNTRHNLQQEELMDTNINKTFVVQRCQVDKVDMNLEQVFRDRTIAKASDGRIDKLCQRPIDKLRDEPIDNLEEFQKHRKRRASADADNFIQPKRPLSSSLAQIIMRKSAENIAEEVKREIKMFESEKGQLQRDLNGNTKTELDCCENDVSVTSRQRHRSGERVKFNMDIKVNNTHNETKNELNNDAIFKSPGNVTKKKKKKHRPEPLIIPPHVNQSGFASRLRSPRLWDPTSHTGTTPPPYTPPPMLSPVRSGSGLFWTMHPKYRSFTPKSAPVFPRLPPQRRNSSSEITDTSAELSSTSSSSEEQVDVELPPETDIQPHVNVGPSYQAVVPQFIGDRASVRPSPEERLWDPRLLNELTEDEMQCYQDFACCAAIPGNGTNKEYALHLLYLCHGDIKKAILRLMQSSNKVYKDEPIAEYKYQESDIWSAEEIEAYHQALLKYNKDFYNISLEMGSKSVKQCIEFYYVWKKVCPDEYKRLRIIRRKRKRDHDDLYDLRSRSNGESNTSTTTTSPKIVVASPKQEVKEKTYMCQYNWCNATFATRQALNGHSRVHSVKHQERMKERENSPKPVARTNQRENSPNPPSRDHTPSRDTPSPARPGSNTSAMSGEAEDFPCKVCGKVFYKVKSRNAHMKTHRQMDPDKSSPRPPSNVAKGSPKPPPYTGKSSPKPSPHLDSANS